MTRRELLEQNRNTAIIAGLSSLPLNSGALLSAQDLLQRCSEHGKGSRNPLPPEDDLDPQIIQEPIPHLKGTAALNLPKNVPWPKARIYPSSGAVFALQLEEENKHWLKEIATTPRLREKLWQPDFSSGYAYDRSVARHRHSLLEMLGSIRQAYLGVETFTHQIAPVCVEDLSPEIKTEFGSRELLFIPGGQACGAVIAIPEGLKSGTRSVRPGGVLDLMTRHNLVMGVCGI